VRRSLRPERLPIRVRVTAVFAASMAVVLAAAGAFVYYGLRTELTEALDDQLETQAAAVARLLVERAGAQPGLTEGLDDPGETFTQVIGPDGRLLTSSPGLPLRPILAPAARRAAAEGADVTLEDVPLAPDDDRDEIDVEALEETGTEPFEEDRARVIARFVDVRGERLTVLVGSTFEDRDEALRTLALILALAAPAALLLTCLVGYGAVRSALGPVELIRRRAASISARNPGERVPVPPADDELARLGRTLNDMLDRLQRALERERTFVADASHELRTPLAILRGELEVALRGSRSRAELEAAVRSAAEEAERLSEIAEGLLLLARSDRGAIPLRLEAIDARRLLEGARDRFEARAGGLGRSLTVDGAEAITIDADPHRVEQALSNLVENALRHGSGTVELAARADGEVVELAVRDQGPGFPPEFIPVAFERFSRASEGRAGPGAGLGLAIAATIAAAHGGEAAVRNREGGGAEVILRLPGRAG
jgi:heavy metal sensor kinase